MPFLSISAPSIVSGMSGESEKTLRDTFDEAKVRRYKPPVTIVSSERLLAESRSLPSLHRRNRCNYSKKGKRTEGDGTTDSRPVPDMHGR